MTKKKSNPRAGVRLSSEEVLEHLYAIRDATVKRWREKAESGENKGVLIDMQSMERSVTEILRQEVIADPDAASGKYNITIEGFDPKLLLGGKNE